MTAASHQHVSIDPRSGQHSQPRPKRIVLIGATGSIGENTLAVIRANRDRLRLVGAAANRDAAGLAAICAEFSVPQAALSDEAAAKATTDFPKETTLGSGPRALVELAQLPEADVVLLAATGTVGLRPALAAMRAGKDIAIASKEILVLAGKFIMAEAQAHGVRVLPIDSEHNAIFQCLEGSRPEQVRRLILTASGGPFLEREPATLKDVTPAEACQHPNWSMGQKVTIDSSTMANKGLELIEAHWLFRAEPSQLAVVIHRQSLVHSMVEFTDGSVIAQISPPSMTFAIQHSLLYPERASTGASEALDWTQAHMMTFEAPDLGRFPCLRLALEALDAGGTAPAIFNAANEIAVAAFLRQRLRYDHIPAIVEAALKSIPAHEPITLEDALSADTRSRTKATEAISSYAI